MDTELLLEAERRGILPEDKATLLAEARKRGLLGDKPGIGERIANAYHGNATEDLPALEKYKFNTAEGNPDILAAGKFALTGVLGNDDDKARRFAELVPGATQRQDANGNTVFETDQGAHYVNRPGLDGMDVALGGLKGASFLPAARLAAAPAGLLARIGVGASAAAGTDIAMQAGAGRNIDQYDPTQTAITAGFGGAGELVGPAIGAARNFLGSTAARFQSPQMLVDVGKRIAQEARIPGTLTDDAYRALGQRAGEIRGGASPASILSEVELGTKLTKGQKTGDYGQQRLEDTLRSRADGSGAILRDAEATNQQAVARGAENLRTSMGANPSSSVDAAQTIQRSVQQQHATAKQAVGEAYDRARAMNAEVPGQFTATLPERARAAVVDFDVNPQLHPATSRALDLLERTMAKPASGEGAVLGADLRQIETTRRQLANLVDSAANNADRAAATTVKRELDSWLDDAVDQSVVTGDVAAIAALKEARAARTKLHQRFEQRGPNDQAGRIVQKMISEEASPDQLAQMVFGAGQLSPAAGANVASKLKAALGDDVEAWNAMRSAVLVKSTTGKTGETFGAAGIVSNLKDLLRNRPTLVKELYSKEEQAAISRFVMAVEPLVKKGDLAKSSGTAERVIGALSSGFGNVPIIGTLLQAIQAPKRYWQASGALQPVGASSAIRVPGALPAGAYAGQEG